MAYVTVSPPVLLGARNVLTITGFAGAADVVVDDAAGVRAGGEIWTACPPAAGDVVGSNGDE